MAKAKAETKDKKGEIIEWFTRFPCPLAHSNGPPQPQRETRWRVLPPEIIRMILQFLKIDKANLFPGSTRISLRRPVVPWPPHHGQRCWAPP